MNNEPNQQREQVSKTASLFAIIVVLVIWLAISTMSCDDAKRDEAEYCQHVRDGLWPDYKGIYATVCGEEL